MLRYKGNNILGILRECHGMWERRSPLSPNQVKTLLKTLPAASQVLVQPCTRRIYSDDEFRAAGAEVTEDISPANTILGVKSVLKENLIANKAYMFFSHTIKAQSYSMPLLDTVLEKNIALFDYECITLDGKDNAPRLVAFGVYAGRAGMIDGLQGLGLKLLAEGYSTPFLNIPSTFMHSSLDEARDSLKKVGLAIKEKGLPDQLSPLVVAFTGSGNVAKGAREVFELFPHVYITPDELPTLKDSIEQGLRPKNVLYGVVCTAEHMVTLTAAGNSSNHNPHPHPHLHPNHNPQEASSKPSFDKQHYYRHPENYKPIFHEAILPYTTFLVNGMYWDRRFPRLVSKQQIQQLRTNGNKTLRAIADISCDINGSIEFLSRPCSLERPFYCYHPEDNSEMDGLSPEGVLLMGIDNLPSELPTDASEHFGSQLLPLLPPLLSWSGMDSNGKGLENLPAPLQRACLTSHGSLMPRWRYINRLREARPEQQSKQQSQQPAAISGVNYALKLQLVGHLFDTGLINQVFDELERHNKGPAIVFSVLACDVRPNNANGRQLSRVVIQLAGGDKDSVHLAADHIIKIVTSHSMAEANASILSQGSTAATIIADHDRRKEVVLLGAGRVAMPFARLFKDRPDVKLIILSDDATQARPMIDIMAEHNNGEFISYNHTVDQHTVLPSLLKRSQTAVVCSLLPAAMHAAIASQALAHSKHMVTASYVSPELQACHSAAVNKKLIFLNEMGLDPGIDHMLCAEARDHIKAIDGDSNKVKITELVSLCGGLPDPVAAALNPLRYKISWSPRGVLTAAQQSARYLQRGSIVEVAGEDLLKAAMPSQRFPTLRLEVLPNRDSLRYQQLYDLPHLHSICRGTLRYEGFCSILYSLKTLGLLDAAPLDQSRSALEVVKAMFPKGLSSSKLRDHLQRCGISNSNGKNNVLGESRQALDEAVAALDWLGLTNDSREEDRFLANQHKAHTALDALSLLMESRLSFNSDERDMVAMFHRIVGEHVDSGRQFVITSRLLEFGTVGGDSAMAATVGYTAAIGAELIVDGELQRHKDMRGVLIPTDKRIYEPVLKRLRQVGINWSDTMTELDKDGNVLSQR
jgi:alpha-aminoadipic semialdehyde synthase